jgi:hypothetical protein
LPARERFTAELSRRARKVALKLLPADLTRDPTRILGFERTHLSPPSPANPSYLSESERVLTTSSIGE